jgi:hypothetical protein
MRDSERSFTFVSKSFSLEAKRRKEDFRRLLGFSKTF